MQRLVPILLVCLPLVPAHATTTTVVLPVVVDGPTSTEGDGTPRWGEFHGVSPGEHGTLTLSLDPDAPFGYDPACDTDLYLDPSWNWEFSFPLSAVTVSPAGTPYSCGFFYELTQDSLSFDGVSIFLAETHHLTLETDTDLSPYIGDLAGLLADFDQIEWRGSWTETLEDSPPSGAAGRVVPEPATGLVLLVGLGGLALGRSPAARAARAAECV